MKSRELDLDVEALAYLVSILIHRLQESDPTWWRKFLDDLRADQAAAVAGTTRDLVFQKIIRVVEHSLGEPDSE